VGEHAWLSSRPGLVVEHACDSVVVVEHVLPQILGVSLSSSGSFISTGLATLCVRQCSFQAAPRFMSLSELGVTPS
jgi:hypothetical protein